MPSVANATNIDTLLVATDKEEKITTPPEALQDKTAFIFNNLSQLNLQQKCDEIREIVTEEYWPWMAQYLVMKRASIELNFHALYSNFLDCIKLPEVNKMVTKETFRNIKVSGTYFDKILIYQIIFLLFKLYLYKFYFILGSFTK
jgi:CCR4-NOT transcription complex subunit 1